VIGVSFVRELKRRNVFKVGAAYAIVAWLLIQVADTLLPTFGAPSWVMRVFAALVILGFPLALVLAWAFELTPEGVKTTASVDPGESITPATGRSLNYAIIALLLVAVVYMFVDNYMLDGTDDVMSAASPEPAPAAAETATERFVLSNSVAVLPLENLSPDPANAFYAAGVHAEIINWLSKLGNLNVISRESVLPYAENRPAMSEIARELGVESLLTGTFQYVNGQIRVALQLVDPSTGRNRWVDEYQDEFADIFAVQADIAMNVANALGAEFSAEERASIERPSTVSTTAYELYLQALTLLPDIDRARPLLEEAVELDPEFAEAHGRIAFILSNTLIDSLGSSAVAADLRADVEALVREHATAALNAVPNEAAAELSLASIDLVYWRWEDAKRSFDRIFESDSSVNVPAAWWIDAWMGNPARTVTLSRRVLAVNPTNPVAHFAMGVAHAYAGDYDAAAAELNDAINLAPSFGIVRYWLAGVQLVRGNQTAARQQLQLAAPFVTNGEIPSSLAELAYAYSRLGENDDVARIVSRFEDVTAETETGTGNKTLINLALGNQEEALRWLAAGVQKAERNELDVSFNIMMNLRMNPFKDPVLEQPEFAALRNRLRGH